MRSLESNTLTAPEVSLEEEIRAFQLECSKQRELFTMIAKARKELFAARVELHSDADNVYVVPDTGDHHYNPYY